MNLKKKSKFISFLTFCVVTTANFMTESAYAAEYTFNRYVGNIYVGKAKVYKNVKNGVTAQAMVNMPKCSLTHILRGYIIFNFKSEDGGYFKNYKYNVLGKEGYTNVIAFVNVPYRMSDRGLLTIQDYTWCESII